MVWITYGFFAIVILTMGIKTVFEWNMYKKSIYSLIYETFTEYRIRKKTVERMSESLKLKELFGAARILYYVLDEKQNKPSSFVTVFLNSGLYVIGISKEMTVTKSLFATTEKFIKDIIISKLNETIYVHEEIPAHVILLVPENAQYKESSHNGERYVAKRSELIETISRIHHVSKESFTEEDLGHICKLFIKEEQSIEYA